MEYNLFTLFDKFVKASQSGKRRQRNGKLVGPKTVYAYQNIRNSLLEFSIAYSFQLRIRPVLKLSKTKWVKEKKYWKKFYIQYHRFLIGKGFSDNYIGFHFKNIKVFFSYLEQEFFQGIGQLCRSFYIPKDDIPVLVLLPEQLNFLITNIEFEQSLPPVLKKTKDIFVFGCTVALRFSDLIGLKKSNLVNTSSACYLRVVSKKTQTETQVKLPAYAIKIIERNKAPNNYLLPRTSLANMNKNIKLLMELAGWTEDLAKLRSVAGKRVEIKTNNRTARFCDQMSSHVMRRTAITTMLILGVPEQVVRKISGHAPASREFFRYVSFSKAFQDQQTDLMFERLISLK